MSRFTALKLPALTAASALLLMMSLSCADDPPAWSDTGIGTPPIGDGSGFPDTTVDSGATTDTKAPPPDMPLWPDTGATDTSTPRDTGYSGSSDTYRGTPFGCADDADCFGVKCCPTPWGVKLCAATCS